VLKPNVVGSRAPEPQILDSHTHCWRVWPYARVPDALTRATYEQLLYEMDLNGVAQTTIVSASIDRNHDNLTYVAQACAVHPDRFHMFAELDCTWSDTYHSPNSADRLLKLADTYTLAGFAHYMKERNDGWLRSDEADAVFALARERGLMVSIGATPNWQADLRSLASRYPTVPVLCQALGLVPEAAGPDSRELGEVLQSADVPNIFLKACGLHYCAQRNWDYPWTGVVGMLSTMFEAYGPTRFCWGSDFPASTRYCTFRQALEVVRTHCSFIDPGDLRLVLGGTLQSLLAARRR
jgi:L-fuconolactonase